MTHDIKTMLDLEKGFSNIRDCFKNYNKNANNINKKYANYCLLELKNKKLKGFEKDKYNDYANLLNFIYEYAKNEKRSDNDSLFIGNAIRRVLELFSYFSFNLNTVKVSTNEKILNCLPNESTKHYFKNLMYRLIINNESHFYENIRSCPETSLLANFSDEEKCRTARDILCFMYELNKLHVLAYLSDSAEENLKVWCNNIEDTFQPSISDNI
jgi:hypothetical protein